MNARFFVTLFLLALLASLQAGLWLGRGSVTRVAELRSELSALKGGNDQARLRNEQLGAEVRDLQEGLEMVEEKARLELGMVKPDEIFVRIDPHSSSAAR